MKSDRQWKSTPIDVQPMGNRGDGAIVDKYRLTQA
jgi:hypothetical protein